MIEKPWRQCVHAAGRWGGPASEEFLPLGPFREGGQIVEVRVYHNYSANATINWMPFVCGTGSLTRENCQAGTPVVGWSNYKVFGLPVVTSRSYIYSTYPVVLPCAIRVVGGAQWVILYVRRGSTGYTHMVASVTVEGVDQVE